MNSKKVCLSTFTLKLIAIITMTIDHIGAVLGADGYGGILTYDTYMILRIVGRIAFPIFCYLIVEGYFYTRSVKKYALRLFAFACISQIPYTLALKGARITFNHLNIFFTLLLGLILVWVIDSTINKIKNTSNLHQSNILPAVLIILLIFYLTDDYLGIDYGIYGLLLILIFYFFRENKSPSAEDIYSYDEAADIKRFTLLFISIGAITLIFSTQLQIYCLFALIPISMHNHKKGRSLKYVFYAYYPIHLLILYFIKIAFK